MKCAGNRVRNPSFGLFWSLERRTAAGRPNGVALGMDVETSSNRESALEIHCWLSLAARLGSSVASILPQLTCVYTHHLERTRPVVFTSVNIQFRKKKKNSCKPPGCKRVSRGRSAGPTASSATATLSLAVAAAICSPTGGGSPPTVTRTRRKTGHCRWEFHGYRYLD